MHYPLFQHHIRLLAISSETTTVLAVVLLIFLMLSFCASGAQIALFSLTYKDINFLKTKQQPAYKRIINLLEQPRPLQGSLIMANVLANIGIIIIMNFMLSEWVPLPAQWLGFVIKMAIVSVVILLFAEILPRTLASQNNIRFAKDWGVLIEGVFLLFKGPSTWMANMSDSIEKALGKRTKLGTREEMHAAIDQTTPQKEQDILKGILGFGDKTVKQVMISRLDVNGIDFNLDFIALKKRVEDMHYSRLPVYNGSLDEIKGIIHTKDLLQHLQNDELFDWRSIMRPAYFVHEQKLIEDLMQEFQQKHIHFAVVADEFGGTSGIVTLEDILEEVIGEITDEFDEIETGDKKIDDMNYIFEGKTMLNDVCRKMGLSADTFDDVKGESDSLAGLILELAGEIPKVNQIIQTGDFVFEVLEVDKNRIQKVKVTIKGEGIV